MLYLISKGVGVQGAYMPQGRHVCSLNWSHYWPRISWPCGFWGCHFSVTIAKGLGIIIIAIIIGKEAPQGAEEMMAAPQRRHIEALWVGAKRLLPGPCFDISRSPEMLWQRVWRGLPLGLGRLHDLVEVIELERGRAGARIKLNKFLGLEKFRPGRKVCFSNLSSSRNTYRAHWNTQSAELHPRGSDSGGLCCIFNKFSGNSDATGLETTLWELPLCRLPCY